MRFFVAACVATVLLASMSTALDNGLALTPPMGWISWQRFRCELDCKNRPNECISEKLYMRIADKMVSDGYRDLGYVQVNIDDCWSLKQRDSKTNKLVADPDRFPSGIKALAKYMHDRGLKLGIYGDAGTSTCAGYPGSEKFVELDAQTIADWDVDMLKFDGCNIAENDMSASYTGMTVALNKTGKPIVYSCEWPLYLHNSKPDYDIVSKTCNIFRNYDDVNDNWDSVRSIMNFYITNQDLFVKYARPGAFFDPDMLVIGNSGLSDDEARAQMSMWTIWAAPLFMSNDLDTVSLEQKKILQNKRIIAINQDKMGRMGKRISQKGDVHVFKKDIQPCYTTGGVEFCSAGIAFINTAGGGEPARVTVTLKDLGLTSSKGYKRTDLFQNDASQQTIQDTDEMIALVNPSGAVFWEFDIIQ